MAPVIIRGLKVVGVTANGGKINHLSHHETIRLIGYAKRVVLSQRAQQPPTIFGVHSREALVFSSKRKHKMKDFNWLVVTQLIRQDYCANDCEDATAAVQSGKQGQRYERKADKRAHRAPCKESYNLSHIG